VAAAQNRLAEIEDAANVIAMFPERRRDLGGLVYERRPGRGTDHHPALTGHDDHPIA
jgi:hypothetical protein